MAATISARIKMRSIGSQFAHVVAARRVYYRAPFWKSIQSERGKERGRE